jgi:hypothetical protein
MKEEMMHSQLPLMGKSSPLNRNHWPTINASLSGRGTEEKGFSIVLDLRIVPQMRSPESFWDPDWDSGQFPTIECLGQPFGEV